MAGLTGRMSTVVKAKVSKLLDRAEDPAETLDYSYQKQVEQLQNVKKGIADVVTAKKRLQMQESTLQQSVVKLDTQARQALAAGKEDLARTALERKNVAQTELQGLDTQVTELEDQQQKLTDSEQKLRAKIEAFRTKKEVIKAQYSAAEAQVRISEAATGVGEQMADVGLAMQRAVDKTENMKARGLRAGSRRHFRRHHPAGRRRRRHRPPAQAALQPAGRRRRAGQDEGRTRPGRARPAARGERRRHR
jgi:phage shock protein A